MPSPFTSDLGGNIAEMSHLYEWVRRCTDVLDTVGNSTWLIGKGPVIGSARFQILKGHVDFTLATNAQNLQYKLKVSEFADLSTSESVSPHAGYTPNNVWSGLEHLRTHEHVGETSVVTPVKNQDQRGSCWAFLNTSSLEGDWCIANASLSPHAHITHFITKTIKANDWKEAPSLGGRSTRASSLDMSPRSPRSLALLPHPTSPRSTFRAESPSLPARLRLLVSPRSSRDLDLTGGQSQSHHNKGRWQGFELRRGHRPGKCHGIQGRAHRQGGSSDPGSDTATRVYRH